MEFTAGQHLALGVTLAIMIAACFGGYFFGRLDASKARLQSSARQHRENQALREESARLQKAIRNQAAHIQHLDGLLMEQGRRAFITPEQQAQITRAAHQLNLCAQLMDGINNHESAKTQRLLASQLHGIAGPRGYMTEAAA